VSADHFKNFISKQMALNLKNSLIKWQFTVLMKPLPIVFCFVKTFSMHVTVCVKCIM